MEGKIVKLFSRDENKFHEVIEKAGLPKLLSTEMRFLKEYCHVMHPVAFALDILQKDKNMYLGYLLPTVLCMERHLENASKLDDKPLRYCEPLRRVLHEAIRRPNRFMYQLQDRSCAMATALLPAFMLNDWVSSENQKDAIKKSILKELETLEGEKQQDQEEDQQARARPAPANSSSSARSFDINDNEWQAADELDVDGDAHEDVNEDLISPEDKIFGFPTQQVSVSQGDTHIESAAEELDRYFLTVNRGWTVQSACIEIFFSGAGLSFRDIRSVLGDATLEKEVLLAMNHRYWSK
ncbi:Leucine--tRNA ligase [Frankliniella fusca]|uniref:Leucine--tRNA ligase n=1 Tax=Frankliniella fusca TaxID=407009 RepID=A0AAE1HNT3_9NEOP|nr:Leucine--tRNA ligase [Frankliniella fusca]